LADLAAWRADRAARGAEGGYPFVASLQAGREALVFSRHTLRKRFRTACRLLGKERLESLTIHHGRHTFISDALVGGRTLAEVRDAVGHSNVSITSGYLHVAVEEGELGRCLLDQPQCPSHQRATRTRCSAPLVNTSARKSPAISPSQLAPTGR
jgi:integrase